VAASRSADLIMETGIITAELKVAIRAELELILAAPPFAQSSRCKSFLSYVVMQTLSGHAGQLKERTIGISVFHRANDYDTGTDSIVRVTSNEVRKRIGQFYRESSDVHMIQIDLPRGSYVPEFRIHPVRGSNEDAEERASEPPDREVASSDVSSIPPIVVTLPDDTNVPVSIQALSAPIDLKVKQSLRNRFVSISLLILLLAGSATTLVVWRSWVKNRIPRVWDTFQRAEAPVLVCLGTHSPIDSRPAPSQETDPVVLRRLSSDTIPIEDVTSITSLASVLGEKGIPFRVVAAKQTSLTDLRRQPVIFIGALDNKWTLLLSQDLPYRIERISSGADQGSIVSILDSQQPASAPLKVDFSIPTAEWKNDYAIVAKADDPKTGISLLIIAGLSKSGSLAASEFISTDEMSKGLTSDPLCGGKSNFEAVLGTDIIDTKPGPPHILRLKCW
jgi:hypothetical protein